MAVQMIVRLDPTTKQRLGRLARAEGKSTSQLMRDALEGYLRDHDPEAHIEDLWARIGQEFEARGHAPGDVERVIAEVRRSRG